MCNDSEMCNGIDPARFTFSFLTEAAHSLDFIVSLNLIQRNETVGSYSLFVTLYFQRTLNLVSDSLRDFDKATLSFRKCDVSQASLVLDRMMCSSRNRK